MSWINKLAQKAADSVYKHFGQDSGKMLLATSMLAISMSSVIQAFAVFFNDKYTTSQKAFMIPQELSEAVLSMVSIFAITLPFQKVSSKLVKTGKLLPKTLVSYMKDNNLLDRRGTIQFDLSKEIKKNINNNMSNSANLRGSSVNLNEHYRAMNDYNEFYDSVSAYSTLAAGLVSTGVVVPLIRNYTASKFQKKNMDYINTKKTKADLILPNTNLYTGKSLRI